MRQRGPRAAEALAVAIQLLAENGLELRESRPVLREPPDEGGDRGARVRRPRRLVGGRVAHLEEQRRGVLGLFERDDEHAERLVEVRQERPRPGEAHPVAAIFRPERRDEIRQRRLQQRDAAREILGKRRRGADVDARPEVFLDGRVVPLARRHPAARLDPEIGHALGGVVAAGPELGPVGRDEARAQGRLQRLDRGF